MMYRPEGLLPEGIGFGALWRRLTGRTLPSQIRMPKTPELIAANGKVATPMPVGTDVTVLSTGRSGGVPTGPVSADSDIVRVEDLAKHFGGIYAVNGVNLVLSENQITALIGPNGAGKTTIFNLITGVLTPTGRVYLRGRDITGKPPNEVATLGMARSFQDTRLFRRLTVLQNVAMAVPHQTGENVASLALRPLRSRRVEEETLAKAMGYLELVEMADTAHALVANLGYGEQKVVAIARLLATESPVLLLDEPTSGIDPAILDDMIALVLRLKALGRTICVVEHSLHVVEKLADHVVFMEDGRVTAEGTIDELTSQQRLVEAYFGT